MSIFNLEERTRKFAFDMRTFLKEMPYDFRSAEDIKQLIRASGSVAANFIEANESFSKKDFYYRVKVCRKEAKESRLWLELLKTTLPSDVDAKRMELLKEAGELMLIFAAIIRKSTAIT